MRLKLSNAMADCSVSNVKTPRISGRTTHNRKNNKNQQINSMKTQQTTIVSATDHRLASSKSLHPQNAINPGSSDARVTTINKQGSLVSKQTHIKHHLPQKQLSLQKDPTTTQAKPTLLNSLFTEIEILNVRHAKKKNGSSRYQNIQNRRIEQQQAIIYQRIKQAKKAARK